MKYYFLIFFGLYCYNCNVFNQNLNLKDKIFINIDEPTIYILYTEKKLLTFWVYKDTSKSVKITTSFYGFYGSCDVPSLDSLKESGRYYFELDSTDFENEELRKIRTYQNCAELTIFSHETDTLMTIYYSSSQQYVTYKRINSLPENVVKYLKEKGIEINNSKR